MYQSLQPDYIIEKLVLEYESKIDYTTPIISLVDVYYDLSLQSKLMGTANIIPALIRNTASLKNIQRTNPEALLLPPTDWCKKAMTCDGSPMWSYCCSFVLFHGCQILAYRMHLQSFDASVIISLDIFSSMSFDLKCYTFLRYCRESADLLTKFCQTLSKFSSTSKVLPGQFLMPILQSTGIHIICALVERYICDEKNYEVSKRNIEINLNFIQTHFMKQVHTRFILKAMRKLINDVELIHMCNKNNDQLRMAFELVHQTLDITIPLIYGENIYDSYVVNVEHADSEDILPFNAEFNSGKLPGSPFENDANATSDLILLLKRIKL